MHTPVNKTHRNTSEVIQTDYLNKCINSEIQRNIEAAHNIVVIDTVNSAALVLDDKDSTLFGQERQAATIAYIK